MHRLTLVALLGLTCTCAPPVRRVPEIADAYLERYFEMYPTRATEEGRTDHDAQLQVPTEDLIRAWLRYQDEVDLALREALARPDATADDHLDAESVLHQTARERHDYVVLRRHENDPLYWTDLAAKATVLHVVRASRPLAARAADAVSRASSIPALVDEAARRLASAPDERLSAEVCRIAAGQAQATAVFYRSTFPAFARSGGVEASEVAMRAADALATLGNALDAASLRATSPGRLGRHYASTMQVGLGTDRSPDDILADAERDLWSLRQEAAAYGRSVWRTVMGARPMPSSDSAVLRALFDRLAADRDEDLTAYTARWRATVQELEAFVRTHRLLSVPGALPLVIAESPAHLLSQSIGSVQPPGAYAPDTTALLFLPVPRDDATAAQRTAFFRDFNRHFNRMIAAHEVLPGHVAQARDAARRPRKVRSVFADPVYVEGWGTFCERLLLDLGWGGPLPRLAHLKKQIENVARVVVDVRVHTTDISRDDVLAFARQQALQDDQFAGNMWTRALTSSPQMVTYHLGYREVREIYDLARRQGGDRFALRSFMDDMMTLGPVALRHYRARYTGRR